MKIACNNGRGAAILLVVVGALCLCLASASPRMKRSGISDQRLAELETLLALSKLKGRAKGVTMPVAFGVIDPDRIGRRKRSERLQNNFLPEDYRENYWNFYPEMAPQQEEQRSRGYDPQLTIRHLDPATLRLWRSWWSRTRRPMNDATPHDYARE